MRQHFFHTVLACASLLAPAGAQATRTSAAQYLAQLGLAKYDVQYVSVPPAVSAELIVPIELEGRSTALVLEPFSILSSDFRLLAQTAAGIEELPVPPIATYRGTVEADPSTQVAASITDAGINATIRLPGRELWIQPVPGEPRLHVVYDRRDVVVGGETCGVPGTAPTLPGPPGEQHDEVPPPDPELSTTGVCYAITEIAFDADFEYFQANGSSTTATMSDIVSLMNGVSFYFRTDTEITYQVGTILVRTTAADPYSSTASGCSGPGILQELEAEWTANQTAIKRDVACVTTGKDLDGSTVGCAFTGSMCLGAYAACQAQFTTNLAQRLALVTHELGHTFDAGHCDGDPQGCNIMCATIGGCSGVVDQFAPVSDIAISTFRASRTCLSDVVWLSPVPPGNPCYGTSSQPYDSLFYAANCSASQWPEQREIRTTPATYYPGAIVLDKRILLVSNGGIARFE